MSSLCADRMHKTVLKRRTQRSRANLYEQDLKSVSEGILLADSYARRMRESNFASDRCLVRIADQTNAVGTIEGRTAGLWRDWQVCVASTSVSGLNADIGSQRDAHKEGATQDAFSDTSYDSCRTLKLIGYKFAAVSRNLWYCSSCCSSNAD